MAGRSQKRTGSTVQKSRRKKSKENTERVHTKETAVGKVLKRITICNMAGEVLPGYIEIRNACRDLRLVPISIVQWQGGHHFRTDARNKTNGARRGAAIVRTDQDTGVVYINGDPLFLDFKLDPEVPSGQVDLICHACGQGVTGGVPCGKHGGNVHYSHCFHCPYGAWNGNYQECQYKATRFNPFLENPKN